MNNKKAYLFYLLLIAWIGAVYSDVVINEIMYDPIGDDTGHEWVELYNAGQQDVNLEGARLMAGGASFATKFTFPYFILRAGRFVLVGEAQIAQAQFTAQLALQNGGGATDGVRFVSADNSYTDTVLYDSPNANGLTDDSGNAGTSFAADVEPGCSLARIADGFDTDACEADFRSEPDPTPGLPNHFQIDYGLENTAVTEADGIFTLDTDIVNASVEAADTLTIRLEVRLNNVLLQSFDIQPIPPSGAQHFFTPLAITPQSAGLLAIELVLFEDVNPLNNTWTMQLGEAAQSGLCLNEILYDPDLGNQEWVELYVPPQSAFQMELTLADVADNSVSFSLPALCPSYLVLCRNQAGLLTRYPDCPPEAVLQLASLPLMNNEGDALVLKDGNGTVIDSMAYSGAASHKDISLERQVSADSVVSWHYCYAEAGGTPGQANSEPPPASALEEGKVEVVGSPFNPASGERMKLQYNFRDAANRISCAVYDLRGVKRFTIASGLSIGKTGELVWNGCGWGGRPLPRGIYVLKVEAQNSGGSYFLNKQLTVVLATK